MPQKLGKIRVRAYPNLMKSTFFKLAMPAIFALVLALVISTHNRSFSLRLKLHHATMPDLEFQLRSMPPVQGQTHHRKH